MSWGEVYSLVETLSNTQIRVKSTPPRAELPNVPVKQDENLPQNYEHYGLAQPRSREAKKTMNRSGETPSVQDILKKFKRVETTIGGGNDDSRKSLERELVD